MGDSHLAIAERPSPGRESEPDGSAQDERIRGLVTEHYAFIWRLMRRLGVSAANAEDAAQDVFIVADRKLRAGWPSNERNFLYAIALRVAANRRRAQRRHLESPEVDLLATLPGLRAQTRCSMRSGRVH